jgi:DNA-binding transcriptional ArsR family regulator
MKKIDVISALSALAQETRLDVFRHLMKKLPDGVLAGDLATKFEVPPSTMSAHLAILARAGLVSFERQSRTISYKAELDGIRDLLEFLVKDCCGGKSNDCNRLLEAALTPARCC